MIYVTHPLFVSFFQSRIALQSSMCTFKISTWHQSEKETISSIARTFWPWTHRSKQPFPSDPELPPSEIVLNASVDRNDVEFLWTEATSEDERVPLIGEAVQNSQRSLEQQSTGGKEFELPPSFSGSENTQYHDVYKYHFRHWWCKAFNLLQNTGANHSKRLPEGASAAVKSSLNKLMTKVKEASARVDKVGR